MDVGDISAIAYEDDSDQMEAEYLNSDDDESFEYGSENNDCINEYASDALDYEDYVAKVLGESHSISPPQTQTSQPSSSRLPKKQSSASTSTSKKEKKKKLIDDESFECGLENNDCIDEYASNAVDYVTTVLSDSQSIFPVKSPQAKTSKQYTLSVKSPQVHTSQPSLSRLPNGKKKSSAST